jgi:hypothetical protein
VLQNALDVIRMRLRIPPRNDSFKNFSPFHSIGLCDAVATTAASAPRCFTIIAAPGVVTISRSITSTPLATNAPTAASRTHGPLGRLSRAKITLSFFPPDLRFKNAANAPDILDTTVGVSDPPIVPRIPEIPIINASIYLGALWICRD